MIKYLITDVDGTLTDGKIYMGENGELFKAFDIKDGYALHDLLPQNGIIPVVVTGRISKIVENRVKELQIKYVYQGVKVKIDWLEQFVKKQGVDLSEIAFMGDDIVDLPCIKVCGFGGCPADAVEEVRQNADYVCRRMGGAAAFREFAQEVVRRQGTCRKSDYSMPKIRG